MTDLGRRAFLTGSAGFALLHGTRELTWAYTSDVSAPALPIIDTHIHLFDPTRQGGVPWPEPSDTVVYRPALPTRYRSLVVPFGVVGAIAVECSPWVEDNDWLLSAAASDPIIVGVIGNLDPAAPDFPRHLDRLAANPLYRGIRYGNLWGRSLGTELSNPGFVANLKRLPASGLLLESANPNPTLIADILKLTDSVPELRIVIDHLPQAVPPQNPQPGKLTSGICKHSAGAATFMSKGQRSFARLMARCQLILIFTVPGWTRSGTCSEKTSCSTAAIGRTAITWRLTPPHSTSSGST